jgi:hypothetical protein
VFSLSFAIFKSPSASNIHSFTLCSFIVFLSTQWFSLPFIGLIMMSLGIFRGAGSRLILTIMSHFVFYPNLYQL